MMSVAVLFAAILQSQDPPPLPPMPGRPPPVADGWGFGGVLGSSCDDVRDGSGWRNDRIVQLSPGQDTGLSASADTFAPAVIVMDLDGRVLTEFSATPGERLATTRIAPPEVTATEDGRFLYRVRVSGGTGPWRIDVDVAGNVRTEPQPLVWPLGPRTGCRPLPPIDPRRTSG